MDIIDVFLERHAILRGELTALEAPFRQPHGVGWDDCLALDGEALRRDADAFFASFRGHALDEDEFLAEAGALLNLDAQTQEAFGEGRRSVGDIMKLFGAVAFTCDGEHVHRVRELLSRMREEVEAHLLFEERTLFPLFKQRVSAALLREHGLRARERVHGRRSR